MIIKEYSTSQGLEQAIKSAAILSGRPVDRALQEYWRSRFLARVFSESNSAFVLKGGTGLLARIPDARRTRDLDLSAAWANNIEDAIEELIRLASHDLGDFFKFQLLDSESIQADAAHRKGACLKFDVFLGVKHLTVLNIDLVVGCTPTGKIDVLQPKNLTGFPLSDVDYRLYPLVDHIADKVCAIMELHDKAQPSSRMKDLVDLCIIATHESVQLKALSHALRSETQTRSLRSVNMLSIPTVWYSEQLRYTKTAKDANLSKQYVDLEKALNLAKNFVDPAFGNAAAEKQWQPDLLTWG